MKVCNTIIYAEINLEEVELIAKALLNMDKKSMTEDEAWLRGDILHNLSIIGNKLTVYEKERINKYEQEIKNAL